MTVQVSRRAGELDPGELVRSILDLSGWSQQRLVKEIRATARELGEPEPLGLDAGTVNRWKRGRQGATSYYLRLLDHLHGSVERRSRSLLQVGADEGMHAPWTEAETMAVLEDWLGAGLIDRRRFIAVPGAVQVAVAMRYLDLQQSRNVGRPRQVDAGGGTSTLVDHVERTVQLLRTLDDAEGGASHLAFVGAQFQALAVVLRQGGHTAGTTRRLFSALAEFGQQAGWMACDAAQHGLAQRYLFISLRAAHHAGDRSMAAHILADLSYLAASWQDPGDGVLLGEAAMRTAAGSPAGVRAAVMTRLAHALALAGRFREATRGRHRAIELLEGRTRADDPAWLYYLTPSHVNAQVGYSLVQAGCRASTAGDRDGARRLLERGEALLRTGAHARDLAHPHQRRALHEGAWLTRCYVAQGDLESARSVARTCIERLVRVRSPRSVAVLQAAADGLRHARSAQVVELRGELVAALADHAER